MHNRTPDPKALENSNSGPSSKLQESNSLKKKKEETRPLSSPHLLLPTYFQSQLTSQNKKWRDGRRRNTSLLHNALVWQLLALTFEAMGTLLKEQMLTDVQAQEHGNYTSG